MMLLVAGSAAILDLILDADRHPGPSEVAVLRANPCTEGHWLPGGAAMTIALAARHECLGVALWHPLPVTGSEVELRRLRDAGIDLSRAPRADAPPARCVMVYDGERRSSWSTRLLGVRPSDTARLLDGVTHVAIAPVWGDWTEVLLAAAANRGVPCSLIGEAAEEARHHQWHTVVIDQRQLDTIGSLDARTLVVTRGGEGATIRDSGTEVVVPAVTATVTDTTGAGDTFGGIFLARRLRGDTVAEAGRRAAAMAARTCEGWGARAAFDSVSLTRPAAPVMGSAPSLAGRVRGALFGTACGDAFGMPNSFLPAPPWRTVMENGPPESPYHAGYAAGRITDDTEQALALTEALEDGFSAKGVAARLNEWFVRVGGAQSLAVGPSTKRALMAYQAGGAVEDIGRAGVTNGGAMRISPIGIYGALAGLPFDALIDAVTVACLPTHATSPAIAGAAAVAAAIAAAVTGRDWDAVMGAAIEGARAGALKGHWVYAASVAARIDQARRLTAGVESKAEVARLISDVVGAGEPTTETVPAALAIADYAGGHPALAIEIGGNVRGDADTIAAIAGAVCGAFAGEDALPADWRRLVARVNGLDVDRWASRLERVAARKRDAEVTS